MAGFIDDHSKSVKVRTLLLVGKTGNGKSATGNSILGRNAFKSKRSPDCVTNTTKLRTTTLKDGQIINVIDTPGLFSKSADPWFVGKEIVKCIGMAKDGIHAVLVVVSLRNRVTMEEMAAIETLQSLFGDKIAEYMILVFTDGDELEDEEEIDDYLSDSEAIEGMLELCGNRWLLFDNKTKHTTKRAQQLNQLLSLVNDVVMKNGGKPFTRELFVEYKRETAKLNSLKANEGKSALEVQISGANEELAAQISNMIETKLMDRIHRLEQQMKDEQEARAKVEATVLAAQWKLDDKMSKMRERLEQQLKDVQEAHVKAEAKSDDEMHRLTERLEQQLKDVQQACAKAKAKSDDEIHKMRERLEQKLKDEQDARVEIEAKSKDEICRLRERLEQQLKDVQETHAKAEAAARATQLKLDDEMHMMRERLEQQLKDEQEARAKVEATVLAAQWKLYDKMSKVRERLKQELKDEQEARAKAEAAARATQLKSDDKMRKMRERFEQQLKDEQDACAKVGEKFNDEIRKLRERLEKQLKDVQESDAKAEQLPEQLN